MGTFEFTDDWLTDHFDHLQDGLGQVLPEALERMRHVCPVAHSDQYGGFWVVTTYDDVFKVAQDWETYSSAHGATVPRAPVATRNIPVEVDPPEQRVYKRLLNSYLTPAKVAPWEEGTRALVSQMIDSFIEDGRCEFMDAFARPFPSQGFFRFGLNAPVDQIEKVAYLASKSSTPHDPEAAECWRGLSEWVRNFLESRRQNPGSGDLVDGIVHSEIDGRPITEDEAIGIVQLVILGGLETTAGALGLMMLRFCRQPHIPEMLRQRPELIPDAVEELLRLDGPFLSMTRTAMRDAELGGCPIKSGDQVMIYFTSADRDAGAFPHPDEFDLDRGSNRHLAFGVGPHRCAGSNVARLNLRVALEELLSRLHDIELEPGADVEFHSTSTQAPLSLPITFTPGPRLAPVAASL